MAAETAVGIDIGGTGIKGARVDIREGKLVTERTRVLTPQPATPVAVARSVAQLFATGGLAGIDPVGGGFPAVIKQGRALTAANLDMSWIGTDVAGTLAAAVGRSVTVLNDADAAGLAEMRFGAGKGHGGVVLMVTLGTGIGCGYFLEGELIPNTEMGHIEIRGKDAEDRAAASARERKKLSWKKWARHVEEYLEALDRLLWPDLVIIGGGVSEHADRFLPHIHVRPPLAVAQMGNDAGIVGAALWGAEHGTHAGSGVSGAPSRTAEGHAQGNRA